MSIAERVRQARTKRGLSAKTLSESAKLSNSYVSQLERSLDDGAPPRAGIIENPSLDVLERLAEALAVPVEWLAFGSGDDPFQELPPDTERPQ